MRRFSIFASAVTAAFAPALVVLALKANADLREVRESRPSAPYTTSSSPPTSALLAEYDGPQPPLPPPHVVMMQQEGSRETRILHREGWVRTESATGASSGFHLTSPGDVIYSMSFSAEGATNLMLTQGEIRRPVYRPTGRSETALGERCDVWSSEPLVHERVYGGPIFSCITADGIVLWMGRLTHYTRAVSVERRPIAWSEMLPPREVLSWLYWSHHFPPPAESATPAYEIRFVGGVQRVRGELRSYSGDEGDYWIRNREAAFTYSIVRGGEWYTLNVRIEPQLPPPPPLLGDATPMDQPPLRLHGETCRWYRIDPDIRWGIVSRCVTPDGISLANVTDFHDEVDRRDEQHVATHFRRGAPTAASMMPPRGLFDPWLAALPN